MPKFPGFGRRKSTANPLEDAQHHTASTSESSFRVFERPGANKSFDGGVKMNRGSRGSVSPVPKDDNIFEELKGNRSSATSNTNTVSTTDNSSRLSGASTTPSSTDLHHQLQENYASPHDKPFSDIPIPPVPSKSASTFSLKHGGRTWSFGRGKGTPSPPKGLEDHPSSNPTPSDFNRPRAGTGESHANMALPLKLENNDVGLNDFSNMFSGFGKRKSTVIAEVEDERKAMSASPDIVSQVVAKPLPSYSNNRSNNPSPLHFDRVREVEPSPMSWDSNGSDEGLMGNISPRYPPLPIDAATAKRASYFQTGSDPTIPTRASYVPAGAGDFSARDSLPSSYNGNSQSTVRPQRPDRVGSDGLRRSSALSTKRKSFVERKEPVDEDARILRESVNMGRRLNDSGKTKSAHFEDDSTAASWRGGNSVQTTPRAHKVEPMSPSLASPTSEDNMFDHSFASDAGLAMSYQEKPTSPPPAQRSSNKVMTPAQFERYKQDQEREILRHGEETPKDDENEEEDTYEDDEDEAEKHREVAKQRRKQEAHMAVYRQQMMKVTGEQPMPLPTRPGMMGSMSTPNLSESPLNGKSSDEGEEDEEVPLAILAAHGFPNKNRPPSQLAQMNSNPNLRGSIAAQMENSGGRTSLPVFARNLPQDPYFGAGLQNPINRESLAFGQNTGAGSVHGGSVYGGSSHGASMPPAGGLVGVIASEERAKAARRASPNVNGGFNHMTPPPGFPGQMPMPSMHGMQPMMGPMGQPMMPQMLTPGDQAQIQMTQQMQQFMQMQMQFMQMMAGQQGSQQQNGGLQLPQMPPFGRSSTMGNLQPPDFLGQGLDAQRPTSSHQQRTFSMMDSQPRSMSMMDTNPAPWMNPQANGSRGSLVAPSINAPGYAPSIAPSERSNIGLPGRYRPVSQAVVADSPDKKRTSTMSGALGAGWENKPIPTIRAVPRKEAEEEDEEEAWAEMKRKKEKKKSIWKSKKDNNGLKEMLGYTT